jgi:type II secretory ATPase GspE/PulE/Tfp pilus assembly ATPase PilB-like protein
MQNIHTLELTKALDLENVTQHVFDTKDATATFAKRFQSILRTDPDVMMAGDTPDAETAQLAAQFSRQGKKVYMGLTANDTFSALRKFGQYVGDAGLLASSLTAVTSQRLVRVLCTNCRRGYRPDPALLKKANLPTGENRPFYRPPNPNEVEVDKQGNPIICPVCQGSGYLGRTGVFELLVVDDDVRAQIASGTSLAAVKTECRKRGMLYLQEIALHKVYDGMTSINEVLRVTKEGDGAGGEAPSPQPVSTT